MSKPSCQQPDCPLPQKARGLCSPHYAQALRSGGISPLARPTPAERFMAKVEKTSGCWTWTADKQPDGYGRFRIGNQLVRAHRAAYTLFVGPIPGGLEVEHACHTRDVSCAGGPACPHRQCVNPAHLELLTHRENNLRGRGFTGANAAKTRCPQGHPYDELNTYVTADGYRRCRICMRATNARYRAKRASSH
jgi:hypothetical protein